jgi:hypothetical protein
VVPDQPEGYLLEQLLNTGGIVDIGIVDVVALAAPPQPVDERGTEVIAAATSCPST